MSDERYRDDLKEIRSLMEHSTRFLSLSGWSGIMAGIYALIGAYKINLITGGHLSADISIVLIGLLIMAAALITGTILTYRKAQKNNEVIFSKTALRMLAHVGFPMLVGAFFTVALVFEGAEQLTAAALLIFYGLGLINGSKYTVHDIRLLGIGNAVLGVFALFVPDYGLYFWAAGFGLGHIIYGTYMWAKYERA